MSVYTRSAVWTIPCMYVSATTRLVFDSHIRMRCSQMTEADGVPCICADINERCLTKHLNVKNTPKIITDYASWQLAAAANNLPAMQATLQLPAAHSNAASSRHFQTVFEFQPGQTCHAAVAMRGRLLRWQPSPPREGFLTAPCPQNMQATQLRACYMRMGGDA